MGKPEYQNSSGSRLSKCGIRLLSKKLVPQALANCQVHCFSELASAHHQPATCLMSLVSSFGVISCNEFFFFYLMKCNPIIPRSMVNMRTTYIFFTSTVYVLRTCIKIYQSLYMCSLSFNPWASVIVGE